MSYTGYLFYRGTTINSVYSYINTYIGQRHHLIDQCVPVLIDTSRERLRSNSHDYLSCPCTKIVRYGDHSFAV